jgi:RNA polymerase sigma factor (sigma-70 family)
MAEAPLTRPSLLVRIRDPRDHEAWRQFVDLYAPLIYGLARRRGMQDADAADVTQEVFRSIAGAAKRLEYDPARGTFRGWLYTVARNKINDAVARRRSQPQGSGDTGTQQLLHDVPDGDVTWDRDFEHRLFVVAAERVRVEFTAPTWQAFWQVAVEGQSAEDTARALAMSLGAVYVAKSRVLARLKKEVRQLQQE